ncbi:MAG: ABC transporter permease [Spirochaetes bacterium]|nr:ABC transporter permease [Spirochaetota bacterium]MBU0956757.1 ABC transporter permease [Spirochaetota bacterium]
MSDTASNAEGFSKKDEVILSPFQLIFVKFKSNRLAMFGLILFLTIVALVSLTNLYTTVTNYDFAHTDASIKNLPPSLQHPFGTDRFGRNNIIRVFQGGWISLQVAFLSTFMAVSIGVLMGAIAGFFGGIIDNVIMRVVEVVSSFPFLALAYIIAAVFRETPAEQRLFLTVFILGILSWTGLARLVRGQIMSLREQEFMVATRALGIKKRNQIVKHLIPNVLAFVVVSGTLTFAGAILSEAFLSFLNLSVTEPIPTWGALLSRAASNSTNMRTVWWQWVFPGFMLFLLIMSVNLIGEGLRDSIDPKATYITRADRKNNKKRKIEEKKIAIQKAATKKMEVAESSKGRV